MRKVLYVIAAAMLLASMAWAGDFNPLTGDKDFDIYLKNLNIEAKADLGKYSASLAVDFSTPQSNIDLLIQKEGMEPAEAYLALKLSKVTGKSLGQVIEAYRANKGKGWGAVARQMGVKPGSPEFHALKGKPRKDKKDDKKADRKAGKGKEAKEDKKKDKAKGNK